MLKDKLTELKAKLIEYATLVESMLSKSMQGLLQKNEALLKETIEQDERRANDFDSDLEEMCTTIIAQYEPLAMDLRITLMILKMNNDLERMADHAVNICESGLFLISRPVLDLQSVENLRLMADTATSMLKDSINALISDNASLARSVCDRDSVVDELGDKILKELIALIHDKQDGIKRALHLMRISQNIERVADLSTNICEEVVYIVEGVNIKHHKG